MGEDSGDLGFVISFLDARIESSHVVLEKWKQELSRNPVQALSFVTSAVRAAATIDLYKHVLSSIRSGKTTKKSLTAWIEREARIRIRWNQPGPLDVGLMEESREAASLLLEVLKDESQNNG